MKFADLFGKATSRWIKYSEYDAVQNGNGDWYIMPSKDALPSVYDPLEKAEEMVAEALNIGLKLMSGAKEFYTDERIIAEICVFAEKYGLLGFMTGLPTTPEFMEYESAYLPKNRYIRKESMPSKEYAKLFFPFDDRLNENPNSNRGYVKEDGSITALRGFVLDSYGACEALRKKVEAKYDMNTITCPKFGIPLWGEPFVIKKWIPLIRKVISKYRNQIAEV